MYYFKGIRSNRTRFIFLWSLSIIILSMFAIQGYYSGQFLLRYDAKIVEFYACAQPAPPDTPLLEATPHFPYTEPTIYVCGVLAGTTFGRIAFHWYLNDVHIYNILAEKVELGFFARLLSPQKANSGYIPGLYRVDAYSGRVKIASTEFVVQ